MKRLQKMVSGPEELSPSEIDRISKTAITAAFEELRRTRGVPEGGMVAYSPSEISAIASTIFVNLVAQVYTDATIRMEFDELATKFSEEMIHSLGRSIVLVRICDPRGGK